MLASDVRMTAENFHPRLSTAPPRPAAFEGPVMPELEAAEVERRHAAFCKEFESYSEVGQVLSRLAATMSVRAERCSYYENATLADRSRQALADLFVPEGLDAAGLAKLRLETECKAMFDSSPEAKQARQYEASSVRFFLRAIKELQRIKRAADAREAAESEARLGSFLMAEKIDAELEAELAALDRASARTDRWPKADPRVPVDFAGSESRFEVPLTVGRRR